MVQDILNKISSKIAWEIGSSFFLLKSKMINPLLQNESATIITGSVRSGTTLALRLSCPHLTPEEEFAGSKFNEPQPLSNFIVFGNYKKAISVLDLTIKNRYNLIKSPHIAFILPYIEAKYKVIFIFRDIRLILNSIFRHKDSQNIYLSKTPYWERYSKSPLPINSDNITRAIRAIETFYENIYDYSGNLVLWNYGFWDEWEANNTEITHLYSRKSETSDEIINDIKNGKLFSSKKFSYDIWKDFCEKFKINSKFEENVMNSNIKIKKMFLKRGLVVKTLEDL